MSSREVFRQLPIDTGPLVAIFCERDTHHVACNELLKQVVPPLLTTWPVITEVAWILRSEPVALQRLLQPRGLFTIVSQGDDALVNFHLLAKKYHNLSPQIADLSILHLAQSVGSQTVFTLDRRDFSVYRIQGKRLRLLPDTSLT